MLRLLRCRFSIEPTMPLCLNGPSPSGDSTLITSAAVSPRIRVPYGPMMTLVRSITRMPWSGPAFAGDLPGEMCEAAGVVMRAILIGHDQK